MSKAAAALFAVPRPLYPERADDAPEGWLEEAGAEALGRLSRRFAARPKRMRDFLAAVHRYAGEYAGMQLQGVAAAAREVRRALRRDALSDDAVARAFALVRETAGLTLGMRHFDCQLQGGWVMLNGMIAEMNTGEGKTLTATLPAATMALAGIHVHVITVNDYLVARDAEIMSPVYKALGLTVGVVLENQQPPQRQAAYRCDITYATNKVLVFDYLRDRITLGQRDSEMHLQMEKLYGADARIRKLLMRGLSFAIVDEADSVLVDEARTPLIISAPSNADDEALVAAKGLELARLLEADQDYVLLEHERRVALTDEGRRRLDELCAGLGGVWKGLLRREELISQALAALYLFKRDVQYLVRDGKVQIIDEYTGRVMEDRSWQRGLHQLVESKEGVEVTAQKEPLARISYQRFFRRYLRFGGMTGTGKEVATEFGSVYGLAVLRIPTNRPIQRKTLPEQVHATEEEKWRAIALDAKAAHARGQPVLLGTRSVAASETASRALAELGLEHVVLNAKQDKEEAAIVSRAGEAGRITVATNMAGRGTDIKLGPGVAQAGGLHVILSERHDSARVDRQLEGRCGRQGDPGTFVSILSLKDDLAAVYGGLTYRALAMWADASGEEGRRRLGSWAIRFTQRMVERLHSRERRALLKADRRTMRMLSFSGRSE